MEITGKVIKKLYAKGSKSERDAVMLQSGSDEYLLRQKDGNPFYDPQLIDLVGKSISCEGVIVGQTLVISKWKIIPD